MKTLEAPILSIGAGNMAHAILSGALDNGTLDISRVAVLDPSEARRALFGTSYEFVSEAASWLTSQSSTQRPLILLAVKPQMLREALVPLVKAMCDARTPPCTLISILAGSNAATIKELARPADSVVRVMPNTPAQIGLGMTAIASDSPSTESDLQSTRTLFQAVGEVIEIPEELMDSFTAVAGSGPAYLFYLAEAMARAAESIGFTDSQARMIVCQTLIGSANLLTRSEDTAAELRAKVTSRNGTTYAATTTLDKRGVMDAFIDALTAARDRGRELAAES